MDMIEEILRQKFQPHADNQQSAGDDFYMRGGRLRTNDEWMENEIRKFMEKGKQPSQRGMMPSMGAGALGAGALGVAGMLIPSMTGDDPRNKAMGMLEQQNMALGGNRPMDQATIANLVNEIVAGPQGDAKQHYGQTYGAIDHDSDMVSEVLASTPSTPAQEKQKPAIKKTAKPKKVSREYEVEGAESDDDAANAAALADFALKSPKKKKSTYRK